MPLNFKRFFITGLFCLLVFSWVAGQTAPPERSALIGPPPVELTGLLEEINRLEADSQRQPKDVPVKLQLAQVQIKGGQFAEGEATLKAILQIERNHAPALVMLGRLYRREYRYEQAFEVLERIKKSAPKDISGQILAADMSLIRMDYQPATAIYKEALRQNPRQLEALYGLAQIAYLENRLDETENYLNQCLEINPSYPRAWLLRAQIQLGRQENTEYAASIRKAVAGDPLDDAARSALASLLMLFEKKLKEGYAEARLALYLNPYSGAHSAIGNGLTPRVYPELSIPLKDQEKQDFLDAVKKGDDLLINQKLTEADESFDRARKLVPNYIPALIGKGSIEYYRNNYDRALDWFFEALKIDPDYGLAHYGITRCLARKTDAVNVRLAEIERRFAEKDAPEPPALRDVFINYAALDPEMQRIIRWSVQPLQSYLPLLKENRATYYFFPFHHFLWQSPYNQKFKGTRTFDGRLWDDVKGLGGQNACSGAEGTRDVKYLRYNILTHELTHLVHGFLPRETKNEIHELYLDAKKNGRTLDFYASSNDLEYFAQGVEAYVSDEKLPDQKNTAGHVRKELEQRDPPLYAFIQKFVAR